MSIWSRGFTCRQIYEHDDPYRHLSWLRERAKNSARIFQDGEF